MLVLVTVLCRAKLRLRSFPHLERLLGGFLVHMESLSLVEAVEVDHQLVLDFLLSADNDLHLSLGDIQKALERGARDNRLETIRKLLAFAPPSIKSNAWWHAMRPGDVAARHGHLGLVQWLLGKHRTMISPVALEEAAENDHLAIVQVLCENELDQHAVTAMEKATFAGCLDIVSFLYGLKPHVCVDRLLEQAVQGGHYNMIQWLEDQRKNKQQQNNRSVCCHCTRNHHWATKKAIKSLDMFALEAMMTINKLQVYEWLAKWLPRQEVFKRFVCCTSGMGDLEMTQWLYTHNKNCCNHHDMQSIRNLGLQQAMYRGHLALVEFYLNLGVVPDSLYDAVTGGQVELVRELRRKYHRETWCVVSGLGDAAMLGHSEMLRFLDRNCKYSYSDDCIYNAAKIGNLEMLRFLLPPCRQLSVWREALRQAIENDELDAIKYIISHFKAMPNVKLTIRSVIGALELIAEQFQVVEVVIANVSLGNCNLKTIIQHAARRRQFEIIRLLHNQRALGFTVDAMDTAAQAGSLKIVRFLHENRTEGCTTKAMDQAASGGFLSVVKFLHENREEGCTTNAIDLAASCGHLNVVKFLLKSRGEGFTVRGVDGAAVTGQLHVLEFFHAHCQVRWTSAALVCAAFGGYLEVVRFLLKHRRKNSETEMALLGACHGGQLEVVEWIVGSGLEVDLTAVLASTRSMTPRHQDVMEVLTDCIDKRSSKRARVSVE